MNISNTNDDHQLMDQHDDNSGEQTDSGISSTFTNDIEQMFADTVNNVRLKFSYLKKVVICFY